MAVDLDRIASDNRRMMEDVLKQGGDFQFQLEAIRDDPNGGHPQIAVFCIGDGDVVKDVMLDVVAKMVATLTECDVLAVSHDAYISLGDEQQSSMPHGWMEEMVVAGRREEFGISDVLTTVAVRRDGAIKMIGQTYSTDSDENITWGDKTVATEWNNPNADVVNGEVAHALRLAMLEPPVLKRFMETMPADLTAELSNNPEWNERRIFWQVCSLTTELAYVSETLHGAVALAAAIPIRDDWEQEIANRFSNRRN